MLASLEEMIVTKPTEDSLIAKVETPGFFGRIRKYLGRACYSIIENRKPSEHIAAAVSLLLSISLQINNANAKVLYVSPPQDIKSTVCNNDDILVNTYTEGRQRLPDIAMNENGDIVITWYSAHEDYSLYDVFAQRFDGEMNKRGEEFQINSPVGHNYSESSVAIDRKGNFVAAWANGIDTRVYAQRFDKDGIRIGDPLVVTSNVEWQWHPHVAMDEESNFIVAFHNGEWVANGYAQIFDRNGNRIGEEFGVVYDRRIAMYDNGDFMTTGIDREALLAHKYNWNGNLMYSVIASNAKGGGLDVEIGQSVVALNDNGFVVVWKDYNSTGTSKYGVYARRFNRDGDSLGDEFQVSSGQVNCWNSWPDVAMDKDGKFIVIWTTSPSGNPKDVHAQRFDENGNRIGAEFQVNDPTHMIGWEGAKVAMNKYTGDFVVSWGNEDVYARKLHFYNPADLNKDGYVDFKDFGVFTDNWLEKGP